MIQLLTIAGGGAVGATLRFLVSSQIYRVLGRDFPYGTFTVNVLGSFLMGTIFILVIERGLLSMEWRNAVMIGFLGAFTTFSTFSIETLNLLEAGEVTRAIMNIALSVSVCLMATWMGMILARQV